MLKQFISVYGNIEYDLMREKRRTIVIHVHPDQSVSVKAPLNAKSDTIEEFVASKIRWIIKHQRHYAAHKPGPPKKFADGEIFHYLGKEYKLRLYNNTGERERVSLDGETISVYSRRPQSSIYARQMLESWYKRQAQKIFKEQLNLCANRYVPDNQPDLAIRHMKSRLGSYSPKTHRVCLNLKLIMVSKKHIDYVIIHELCHITHLSHDKKFYALLSRYLPKWKQLETELESTLLRIGE